MRGCQQLGVTRKLSIAMIYDKQAPFEKNNWNRCKKNRMLSKRAFDMGLIGYLIFCTNVNFRTHLNYKT